MFIYIIFIYLLLVFIYHSCANTLQQSAGRESDAYAPSRVFNCISDHPFVIKCQVCNLSSKSQVSITLHYAISLLQPYNTQPTLLACQCRGPKVKFQICSGNQGFEPRTFVPGYWIICAESVTTRPPRPQWPGWFCGYTVNSVVFINCLYKLVCNNLVFTDLFIQVGL